jgi:NAD+ synthase (glutamine-hydrolysing)
MTLKLAFCQINTTVGDFAGNAARVLEASQRAVAEGAALALFPELAISGYPPRDLLDRPSVIADNVHALQNLAEEAPRELSILVGFVEPLEGKLYNAAALLRGGSVQQVFHKRLLPTYDVFDEDRYFEPGRLPLTFELAGTRFGVTICEDAWNDDRSLARFHEGNPVVECVREGADVLINIAASPFTLKKLAARPGMLSAIAQRYGRPLAFLNLVGGNDDLIFDGSSALFTTSGQETFRCKSFADDVVVAALDGVDTSPHHEPLGRAGAALDALVLGTRDYARKCGFTRAVLGLSGGVDSSLVAVIAAEALGASNVLGVAMPTRYSSAGSLTDAAELAHSLGIGYRVIDIEPLFASYLERLTPELAALGPAPERDTTFENIQARIRGNTLMAISNRLGHLLLTTGNKSEVAVGYCTLYGDMAGGLAVISDLPKTFVYEVCAELNRRAGRALIPQAVIDKAPSAELRPDQRDDDSLPPYPVLDALLEQIVEEGRSVDEIIAAGGDRALAERVMRLVRGAEYKRKQMPPGLIITRKAFGQGRRYPIAAK